MQECLQEVNGGGVVSPALFVGVESQIYSGSNEEKVFHQTISTSGMQNTFAKMSAEKRKANDYCSSSTDSNSVTVSPSVEAKLKTESGRGATEETAISVLFPPPPPISRSCAFSSSSPSWNAADEELLKRGLGIFSSSSSLSSSSSNNVADKELLRRDRIRTDYIFATHTPPPSSFSSYKGSLSSSSYNDSLSSSSSIAAEEQLPKRTRVKSLVEEGLIEGFAAGRVQGREELSSIISKIVTCPITQCLMAYPVIADDDRTYERSAIIEWLETHTTSPIDLSTPIRAATLRKSKAVNDMIEALVKSDDIDDETKEAWQKRLDEPQRLFDEGRDLEAAYLGHVEAMGQMAWNYYMGAGEVAEDKEKAFDFAKKAAKEGDGQGMYILGRCYFYGAGVAADQVAAVKWHEEAAEKGNMHAMYSSGQSYSAGQGCAKDDDKAAEYFKNASEKGHQYATNELGNCYYEGAGVPKNLETAREFFEKASDRKHSLGDVNLGTMMICGEGGEKEVGKGFTLIEKAAGVGNKCAVARLEEIDNVVKKWQKTGVFKLGTH